MPLTLKQLQAIDPAQIVVLDTETTELNRNDTDEAVSLAMVDGTGKVLFDTLLKPEHRRTWKEAEHIHGITPQNVKNAPRLSKIIGQVAAYLANAQLVVGYNLKFDLGILRVEVPRAKQFDVMLEFASFYGEKWPSGERKWSKLTECAGHYGYVYPPHGALEDTKATLHCFNALLQDRNYKPAKRALIAAGVAKPRAQKSTAQAMIEEPKPQTPAKASETNPAKTIDMRRAGLRLLSIAFLIPGAFCLICGIFGLSQWARYANGDLVPYVITLAIFFVGGAFLIKKSLDFRAKAKQR